MNAQLNFRKVFAWFFGLLILTIGILNLILVHPVPGLVYIILSLIFFPPTNELLTKAAGFTIPVAVKIILGIVILWFTLGISDLAEIFGL